MRRAQTSHSTNWQSHLPARFFTFMVKHVLPSRIPSPSHMKYTPEMLPPTEVIRYIPPWFRLGNQYLNLWLRGTDQSIQYLCL